ncbi:alpha/beta fold hydrolase [Arthrobacter cheniae]|uniref:Alpha/beta fold hydrolase n=1 Tax=Arthrobacter cheniae TaxID=1258888 RepID=A0A3A5MBY4_9MICC|nr:alpha/beta fold hydrolase [Arthrobacter cheniae]RJT80222.1 alpha/beta fold hydrolase [Arthrobacter cheniae]
MASIRLSGFLPFLLQRRTNQPADDPTSAEPVPVSYRASTTVRTTLRPGSGDHLDVSYRLHSSRRATDGGQRQVFVLVHGIGMSHRYFARLQAELLPYGDTIVLDLPGFGGTPTPARQLGVADYAAVIAGALEDARLSSCVVIGHSMGAQFVTELAIQHPELVSAVVLIGPVTDTSHPSAARNAGVLALDTLLERPVTNLLVGGAYLRCGIRWYLQELPVMLGYRLDERIAHVARPVLILRGSLDPIASGTWCRKLAGAARDGSVVEVRGQSHAAHRAGARDVADAILHLVGSLPVHPSVTANVDGHARADHEEHPSRRTLAVPSRTSTVSAEGSTTTPRLPRSGSPSDWRSITVGDRECRAYVMEDRIRDHEARGGGRPSTDPIPVFVLVHGIGMSHRYFLRLGRQLSRHGTVLVIDLPGYGWTGRPAHRVTNPASAELLATLLDHLGVSSSIVIGHSMGVQTATELAVRRPDLASRLVLIGAAVDVRRRTVPEQALTLGLNSILEKPLLNTVQFLDVLRCGPRWYFAELAVAMSYPLEERLPLATQPVLVLRGSRDLVAGDRWSRSLADSSRDGTLVVVDGAPHAVHHSSAAVVARHIVAFIAEAETRMPAEVSSH